MNNKKEIFCFVAYCIAIAYIKVYGTVTDPILQTFLADKLLKFFLPLAFIHAICRLLMYLQGRSQKNSMGGPS